MGVILLNILRYGGCCRVVGGLSSLRVENFIPRNSSVRVSEYCLGDFPCLDTYDFLKWINSYETVGICNIVAFYSLFCGVGQSNIRMLLHIQIRQFQKD